VIVNQGPRACGMPEMFRIGELISRRPELMTTAVVTDGRYSGCSIGPTIGYVCPEAAAGGPIGRVRTGDLIELDIPNRTLTLVNGGKLLAERKPAEAEEKRRYGALDLYRQNALQALDGATMGVPY